MRDAPADLDHDLEGSIEGMPAFRCRVNAAGGWTFRCSCGKTHTHGAGEGHRAGHCPTHRPYGYFLIAPVHQKENKS